MSGVDTIFALSSGALPCAIAIVRVSGPAVTDIAAAMLGGLPRPRHAVLRRIRHPATGELLDEGLVLRFPAVHSVTGEDLLELHCHGSRAVVAAIGAALAGLPGVRAARPGEFTRRSFENGRTDLSRIEGLGDLLAAETATQRRAALHMMEGRFSARIAQWQAALSGIAAAIEAQLDFADEDDVALRGDVRANIGSRVAGLVDIIDEQLALPSATRLRDGFRVVIAGPPNVGKSSLYNALLGRDAAIVSDLAGTTRDLVEAPVSFDGCAFVLVDSAGLRDATGDRIEAIGIERAARAVERADIVLWMGAPADRPEGTARCIQIRGKADLADSGISDGAIAVSSVTMAGMAELVAELVRIAGELAPRAEDYALSDRQRGLLERTREALAGAMAHEDDILRAESVRAAAASLAELTGVAATEAMLDALFGGFCIGK